MAENTQGIMALPENDDMRRPTISLDDSYDAITTALTAARPDAAEAIDNTIAEAGMDLSELTDEQIDALIQAIQYLYDNPEEYKKTVEELIAKDYIDEGDLPAEYDSAFLSSFGMMLLQERRSRGTSTMTPPPQEFARGGIAEAARILASKGRNGDTMLAHITPEEARLLRSRGGSGTINPETGLPEFWNPVSAFVDAVGSAFKSVTGAIKSAFKTVGSVVKKVLSSDVGRIAATIALSVYLGPQGAQLMNAGFASATAAGTVTLASGGDVKDALKSAAFAYFTTPSSAPVTNAAGQVTTPGFTNPISEWVGSTTAKYAGNPFVDGAVKAFTSMPESVQKGITSVGLGTLAGVATGQDLQDAVKTGLTSGAVTTGIEAVNAARTGMASGQQALKTTAEAVDDAAASNMRSARNIFEQGLAEGPPEGILQPGADIMKAGLGTADDINTLKATELARAQRELSLEPAKDVLGKGITSVPVDSAVSAMDVDAAAARKAGLSTTSPSYVDSGMIPDYVETYPAVPPRLNDYRNVLDIREGTTTAAPSAPSITGGIKDIVSGDFSKGFQQLKGGITDLYDEYLSPSEREQRGLESAAQKAASQTAAAEQAAIAAGKPLTEAQSSAFYNKALDAASPGVISKYGPITAAGIAGLGLMGGFKQDQPPPSPLRQELSGTPGEDLIAGAPSEYVVQNLPGVTYSPEGQIVSVNAAQPTATLADVQQATGTYGMPIGMPQQGMPSAYMQDPYGYLYAQRQLIQPTQLADGGLATLGMTPTVYDSPVMNPMMQGGITTLRHGGTPHYPRRTGQISGPGTETSDDIPAMLSDGEFVMTARAVRGMGGGNRREGAKRMYALMHQLEKNAARG